jgi:hypothetical protein
VFYFGDVFGSGFNFGDVSRSAFVIGDVYGLHTNRLPSLKLIVSDLLGSRFYFGDVFWKHVLFW